MRYIYGPVMSRRLGRSLGVDPIPLKTCNWNCVYCQLGRTVPLTNMRSEYVPYLDILGELHLALTRASAESIDWVTFVGSGEPTLHCHLGRLLRETKQLTNLPLAVITNGSLLYLPEVRQDLLVADAVLPTLSAGSADVYRQLHRPHPALTFERHLNGLIAFRRAYRGRLWVELMLVKGINDTAAALRDLARVLQLVEPDLVHISTPTRPPSEAWVEPPDDEGLMRAVALLGDVAHVLQPVELPYTFTGDEPVATAIRDIVARHPLSQRQLVEALLPWGSDAVAEALRQLEDEGSIQCVDRFGTLFWASSKSHYPDAQHSIATEPDSIRRRRAAAST